MQAITRVNNQALVSSFSQCINATTYVVRLISNSRADTYVSAHPVGRGRVSCFEQVKTWLLIAKPMNRSWIPVQTHDGNKLWRQWSRLQRTLGGCVQWYMAITNVHACAKISPLGPRRNSNTLSIITRLNYVHVSQPISTVASISQSLYTPDRRSYPGLETSRIPTITQTAPPTKPPLKQARQQCPRPVESNTRKTTKPPQKLVPAQFQ